MCLFKKIKQHRCSHEFVEIGKSHYNRFLCQVFLECKKCHKKESKFRSWTEEEKKEMANEYKKLIEEIKKEKLGE